jgi:hypothetical protein
MACRVRQAPAAERHPAAPDGDRHAAGEARRRPDAHHGPVVEADADLRGRHADRPGARVVEVEDLRGVVAEPGPVLRADLGEADPVPEAADLRGGEGREHEARGQGARERQRPSSDGSCQGSFASHQGLQAGPSPQAAGPAGPRALPSRSAWRSSCAVRPAARSAGCRTAHVGATAGYHRSPLHGADVATTSEQRAARAPAPRGGPASCELPADAAVLHHRRHPRRGHLRARAGWEARSAAAIWTAFLGRAPAGRVSTAFASAELVGKYHAGPPAALYTHKAFRIPFP